MDQYADMADWDKIIQQIDLDKTTSLNPCGCCAPSCLDEQTPLGEIFSRSDCFSVGFHGMMDVVNFDLERARRCCVHALAPDGKLIPFCLYNIMFRRRYWI